MKRNFLPLALTLALLLGLFAPAKAAAPGGAADGGYLFVACYGEDGGFTGVRVLPADATAADVGSAASVRFIRTDGDLVPQGNTAPVTVNYTKVRRIDGAVTLCCDCGGGVTLTRPVTGKITGEPSRASTDSVTLDGTAYTFTDLTVEGCGLPVTKRDFQSGRNSARDYFGADFDFYLDPKGEICWAEQVSDSRYASPCVVLEADYADGKVTVQLLGLLDNKAQVQTVVIDQLNGKPADSFAAAYELNVNAKTLFYQLRTLAGGKQGLSVLSDKASFTAVASTGNGVDTVATVTSEMVYARQAGGTAPALPAIPYADSEWTHFIRIRHRGSETLYYYYRGYANLPTVKNVTLVTAIAETKDPTVARYVLLETVD